MVLYLVLYLVLGVALASAFGSGSIRIGGDSDAWVEWGVRGFSTREELSSWLAARGGTYEEWARKHPDAAAQLESGGPPAHLALAWPPTIRGEIPVSRGGAASAALAAALLAAAFMFRRRLAYRVATLPLLVVAALGPLFLGCAIIALMLRR
jgi:hypothetical protein